MESFEALGGRVFGYKYHFGAKGVYAENNRV